VVMSSEEGVGKLQGGVGKLGVGLIGVKKGRGRVLHGEQGAAVVGNGAPAEIQWYLRAGEHEQVLEKLSRGLMGAMGGRWRLPTAASSSPEWRKGGRRWCSGSGCARQRKGGGNGSSIVCWYC
jgi:hypothetical protein